MELKNTQVQEPKEIKWVKKTVYLRTETVRKAKKIASEHGATLAGFLRSIIEKGLS